MIMNYSEIFKKAYELMDESIIDGNCGLLCNFHCCRDKDENGERLGIYLLPEEYEAVFIEHPEIEVESLSKEEHGDLYLPESIGNLHYMYCGGAMDCVRELRPIHCRTYPLEPHIEQGKLMLVIEKEQIHKCPILKMENEWRKEYINGVFEGWKLLIQIPKIRTMVKYESNERIRSNNIKKVIKNF